jgi:FAD/FMN-containing dehydrogenase
MTSLRLIQPCGQLAGGTTLLVADTPTTNQSIEIHGEDQYAIVHPSVTLAELWAALPPNLAYRAPKIALPLSAWLLAAGVGLLNAAPVRQDVLGLGYRDRTGQLVEAGGRVVKNVAGLDLVRLIVGSGAEIELASVTLRLRPRPTITERMLVTRDPALLWDELRASGAQYALAQASSDGNTHDDWQVWAWWWGAAPAGLGVAPSVWPRPAALVDALGAWPRLAQPIAPLAGRVLAALCG